ncbi:hypothetical protein DENSPDRAFT_208543 [Dentipellis sp. KUC8613]|nr:hypothetical protein DENSPDRAFT_208543 [Dentipellis sp. KUC8613]
MERNFIRELENSPRDEAVLPRRGKSSPRQLPCLGALRYTASPSLSVDYSVVSTPVSHDAFHFVDLLSLSPHAGHRKRMYSHRCRPWSGQRVRAFVAGGFRSHLPDVLNHICSESNNPCRSHPMATHHEKHAMRNVNTTTCCSRLFVRSEAPGGGTVVKWRKNKEL